MIRVGYMGIPFSNSAEMSVRLSRAIGLEVCEHVPLMSSGAVVDALLDGTIDYGVLPIRNSSAGTVVETEVAMRGAGMELLCTEWMQVHHCVFVRYEGAEVTRVVSHVQALLQSKGNLSRLFPDAELVECENTAYAAEMLANGALGPGSAALCRRDAGEHYGLHLLHENVEDEEGNMTQFAIFRRV